MKSRAKIYAEQSASLLRSRTVPSFSTVDLFDDTLIALGKKNRKSYKNADPFPHIIIDNLFPEDVLHAICGELGHSEKAVKRNFYGAEKKEATEGRKPLGPITRQFMEEMNSVEMVDFLEALTGVDSLITDATFEGGGIHQINRGGVPQGAYGLQLAWTAKAGPPPEPSHLS